LKKTFQIIFSGTSGEELAALPTALQLTLTASLETIPENFKAGAGAGGEGDYGRLEREGRTIYRYRAGDYRIYFEKGERGIVVHRVLNRNSLKDFLFRSNLPVSAPEDEALQKNPDFWKMIDGPKSQQ